MSSARLSPRCCPRPSSARLKACSIFSVFKSSQQPCRDFDFTVTFGILKNCRALLGIFYIFYLSITTEPLGPSVLRLSYYHINLHGDLDPL